MNRIINNNFDKNNIYFNSKKSEEKKSMESEIQTAINKLTERAQREMVEYGDFATISEKFKNNDENLDVGDPSIKIVYANSKKDKTLKYLELEVPSTTGKSKVDFTMELANKKDILDILSDEKIINRIKENVRNASNILEDGNYM